MGPDDDVTAAMRSREQALVLLAGKVAPGPEFFEVAAHALALGLGCRWAGIGELRRDGGSVQLLAFWDGDGAAPTFAFELPGSPCHEVYHSDPNDPHGFFPRAVADRFPDFPLLARMGARSYRGEIFRDTHGRPVGHVFAISERDEDDSPEVRDFFRLVAQRVGAEHNRWRAEEALHWYEDMLSTTSDRMALIDTSYVYRAVNQSYVDAVNLRRRGGEPWTREDLVGRTVGEAMGEEFFRAKIQPHLDRCFAGSEVNVQRWLEVPGTPRRYLYARHHPYRAEDGSILGTVVIIRDLTRRRRDQQKIVELASHEALIAGDLEAASRLICEALADGLEVEQVGVWLFEDERRQLLCQDLFERSTRAHSSGTALLVADSPLTFEALVEGSTIDAHDARSDPRTRELVERQSWAAGTVSMLGAAIRVDGELVGFFCHCHLGAPRTWQADETSFAGEAADLVAQTLRNRERHELERRLHQAQKMESLGVLAGGIAHDFNNLLVGILGGADLALSNLETGSRAHRQLQTVRKAALQASDLCSQMLAYSGKGSFLVEAVNLSEMVEETAPLLHASLQKNAALRFDLRPDLPLAEVDVTQVRQIVMNLLTNAADALDDSGGVVTVTSGTELLGQRDLTGAPVESRPAAGPYVYLEVADTGCGMDEATRSRIFEPFFTTKFTGRGLGLAAVLGIVRSHHGTLEIDSRPSHGTRIRVYFPAAPQAAAVLDETSPPVPAREPARGTVLVVDDEELVRLVASEMLEDAGFEVLTAPDGIDGVGVVEQRGEEIDAVILDVTMPGMSGEEAFEQMRRLRRGLPILLASGYSEEETVQRFAGKDIAGFVHKPFRAETFVDILRQALPSRANSG